MAFTLLGSDPVIFRCKKVKNKNRLRTNLVAVLRVFVLTVRDVTTGAVNRIVCHPVVEQY